MSEEETTTSWRQGWSGLGSVNKQPELVVYMVLWAGRGCLGCGRGMQVRGTRNVGESGRAVMWVFSDGSESGSLVWGVWAVGCGLGAGRWAVGGEGEGAWTRLGEVKGRHKRDATRERLAGWRWRCWSVCAVGLLVWWSGGLLACLRREWQRLDSMQGPL